MTGTRCAPVVKATLMNPFLHDNKVANLRVAHTALHCRTAAVLQLGLIA